ncbi:MAG: SRPBCC family protein [Betaproteobacteria bacterium]|nr:SRPBCC family protein [Betaproteobacteria bacterium]
MKARSRRTAVRLVLLWAAAASLVAVCPARAEDPHADVRISRQGRTFVVEATLEAPVTPALAWEVLTDFERMEKFVPNLADSRIVARDGNRLTILQHGVARFGPFTLRFESERVVTLAPPSSIRSTQIRGTMEQLDSLTTFAASPGGTRLDYHVEAIPGVLYPDALTRRFLQHEIAEQFEAIVREMVRRRDAARPGAPPPALNG